MLTFNDPPAGMTIEFGSEAFEHRFSRFLALKEQRRADPAREQADRAKRPHASDSNRLEGYVTERVPIEQAQPLRRKTLLVGGKHAIGVDAVPRVALSREMVDQRRLVYDPHLTTRYEMREVVILFEPFTRLGEDGMELSPQRAVLDIFDFASQLYPAVPDFQRRELGKSAHAGAVGFDGRGRGRACPLVRKLRCQRGHRDACSQSLEVDREVDAGQRLVEIIDVEKNVFLWGREGSEVHQMAVAAGLHGNPRARLMPQVLRHHRGRAAQEGEWACEHAVVANRYQLRHARAVAARQDRYRVAIGGPKQISVLFAGFFCR